MVNELKLVIQELKNKPEKEKEEWEFKVIYNYGRLDKVIATKKQ